jgi:hypothetical protein
MNPEGVGYDGLDFLQLAQVGIYRWDLRNTAVETLCFYIKFAWGVGEIL